MPAISPPYFSREELKQTESRSRFRLHDKGGEAEGETRRKMMLAFSAGSPFRIFRCVFFPKTENDLAPYRICLRQNGGERRPCTPCSVEDKDGVQDNVGDRTDED